MGVRKLARAGLVAAAAVALGALPASAQNLTFSTTGTFSGGSGGTVCIATSCTSGGFTLSFSDAPAAGYLAPTLLDLGQFVVTAAGASQPLTAWDLAPSPVPSVVQLRTTRRLVHSFGRRPRRR